MRRKPAEVRSLALVSFTTELFAFLVVGYAFLLPMATSYAILFALSVSLAMTGAEAMRHYIDFSRTRTLEFVWLNELTLRYAINDLLASVADAQIPKVDWREKMRAAIDDVRMADVEFEMEDKMADGALIGTVAYGITMPVMFLARPVGGLGAAFLAERFAPALVQLITPT